jgi:hypothetical protein
MEWFSTLIRSFTGLFKWWIITMPWEHAVRVRLGRHISVHRKGGVIFRIPYVDKIFVQNVRDRVSCTTPQTLTTSDGQTITLCAAIRFSIKDILPMYQKLHQASETIKNEVEGLFSEYVIGHTSAECQPHLVTAYVQENLDLSRYGLELTSVLVTDFARVRTYRMITGSMVERWVEDELSTRPQYRD